ncbi:hypothetical protein K490DRAFT_67116 [Saccharata proteae CBS 121410]|uniref:UBC core domain-containing protein n=1 Tax=Saccharata proteae CBS 121410 TaxID=1314787 RepID=A0A9P4HVV2_9PEZI|nr:hypothetical protein K490DRAFT_67116 [Saccharata proteae CBS 121410]
MSESMVRSINIPRGSQTEDLQLCVEDTCRLKRKPWMIGVVDRTHNDVDSHDPEPQNEYSLAIERHPSIDPSVFLQFMRSGVPPPDTALISWQTDFVAELLPRSELEIVDRSLLVGDIVKRSAKDAMSGTVISVSMRCVLAPILMWPDVEEIRAGRAYETLIGDDLARQVRDVPTSELTPVRQWPEGGIIVYDNWVGRIEDTVDEVTVRLANGTVVVVENTEELMPVDPRLERHEVGDVVKTKKGNLRRGRWIFGAFNPNVEPTGVVIDVRTITVNAAWLSRRLGSEMPGSWTNEPPVDLNLDELESGRVHLYDSTKLPPLQLAQSTSFQTQELIAGQRVQFKDMAGACVKYNIRRTPRTETSGFDTNLFTVQSTETIVSVQWQNLTVTEEKSASLLPSRDIDDEDEVWPGEIVCTNENDPASLDTWYKAPKKVGVVQTVDGVERMASVKWFREEHTVVRFVGTDLLPGARLGPLIDDVSENVSLYDIHATPTLSRTRGDYVIIYGNSYGTADGAAIHSDAIDWLGEVVDLGLDGLITVRLGAMDPVRDVKVKPECAILAYNTSFDDQAADPTYEDMSDEEEEDWDEMDEYESDQDQFTEMWYEYQTPGGERVRVEAESEDGAWSTEEEDDEGSSPEDGDVDMTGTSPNEVDTSKTTPELQTEKPAERPSDQLDTNEEISNSTQSGGTGEPLSFSAYPDAPPAFAILESEPPTDHHYYGEAGVHSSQRIRRIQKEHKILGSSLPPGIFVRTWESRLDLLRVLIIGPIDTPYEYAPFLIDFHLGSSYPLSAPEAFFHSWTNGLGPVNPNLYEDGKICLSLLGTWHADERNENWSPGKSTLLQVLVSLLGLVLVKEPYYNEAGYEVRHGTEESALPSALYSEKTYFRARNFITHALTNLPAPFGDDIKWAYLDERGPRLLDKAIEVANGIIANSEVEQVDGARDGLRRVSRGAVTMLKRQVQGLEGLRAA